MPRLLDNLDADAAAQLRDKTERIGVAIQTGPSFGGSSEQRTGSASSIKRGIETHSQAERVVNGAGRVANVDGLGKVRSERRRIALDAYLRSTSNPAVYVCGDAVAETAELSPIATYEGRIVGRNIVDGA